MNFTRKRQKNEQKKKIQNCTKQTKRGEKEAKRKRENNNTKRKKNYSLSTSSA